MTMAIQHRQAGRLEVAERICRRILQIEPDRADAIHLLGLIANQARKPDEAVACYRRVLELKPDFAEAHYNLGNVLRKEGKLEEATACYCRALELKPDLAEALNNLGNTLKDRGKLDEATACYRRALGLKPDSAVTHNNLGATLKNQGRLDEAAACYRRALELEATYAEAHYNLGDVLKEQGKLDEAVACYRRTLELKPDFAEAHGNLGIALNNQGKPDDAVACYRRALALKPGLAEVHNNLGVVLKEQGKLDEAVACYRRALELKPDYAEVHSNLGDVLEEIGDLKAAEGSFRAALQHDAQFAFAHFKLAELLGQRLPQQNLAAQRCLLQAGPVSGGQKDLTDSERLLLHFGLAQVMDARGAYAEAAQHIESGNALQLSEWRNRGQRYNPQEHALFVARTIDVCTPEFFARVRGFGSESALPVFVVGLPRSGTTLIEQILASHSQVFGAGEIQLASDTMAALAGRGADSLEGLRRLDRETALRLASQHLERLRPSGCTALRIVDKMPDNYVLLGLLACLFPQAKLIHCRRDLRDVAVSCWITHFRNIRWANDQEHIASRFREYRRLMEHWRKVLPVPFLEIDYEEIVADLEGAARKLVAWCGLAWEPQCLEFHQTKRPVKTASAVQVRQPLYATSVGRWKHYEHLLGSLFTRLETMP